MSLRQQLDDRSDELVAAREAVSDLEARVASSGATDDHGSDDLHERMAVLEARESELLGQIEDLTTDAARSDALVAQLTQREDQINEAQEALREREGELERRLAQLEEGQHAVGGADDPTPSDTAHETHPVQTESDVDGGSLDGGMSLADRIAAGAATDGEPDSLDAIRSAAMVALEEARAIKERSFAEAHGERTPDPSSVPHMPSDNHVTFADPDAPVTFGDETSDRTTAEDQHETPSTVGGDPFAPAPDLHIDYSPAVAPQPKAEVADEDEEGEAEDFLPRVESRYSRNSAKLPRIGVEPGSNSDTIANLRKQMTADD